jgi:DNA sulfur modification protein DndD
MLTELERRDRNILGRLGRRKEFKQACLILESLFSEDRELRTKSSLAVRYLNLERSELQSVQRLTKSSLEEIRRKAIKLIQEHSLLNEKVLRLDETLGTVPDEAAIAHLTEQLALAQKEHYRKQAESSLQNEKVEQLRRSIGDQEREMTTILERRISERSESEDVTRKIKFSGRVRETMKLFRIKVLERKIRQIEALILESFQQLLRKKELVTAIRIDPQTYRMTLLGENGSELHADRLSAGERQLLAVSTLWGLARASGRPLPTIIDTPLGRLDSHHRANLVNSYFPYASHQVIILSTDEEIGKTHLAALKPRITRTFELSYSSATKSTEVIQGYFFN